MPLGSLCQFVGGSQQKCLIFWVAGLIEAEHCQLVACGLVAAMQQIFDRGAEGVRDATDIAAQLAGAVGLPLGDGASADITSGCQFILGETACAAESADACADGWLVFHQESMSEMG